MTLKGIQGRLLIGFVLVSLLTSLLIGGVTYFSTIAKDQTSIRNELMVASQLAAAAMDGDALAALKAGDEETPAYQAILKVLRTMKDAAGITYLYTFLPESDEQVRFAVDSDDTEDQALIGDLYPNIDEGKVIDPNIKIAFSGKVAINMEPYTDDWGTFVSGFAPVYATDGNVVAVVGADIDIQDILARQWNNLLFSIFLMAVSLIISIIIAIFLTRGFMKPIVRMIIRVHEVSSRSGDLTVLLPVERKDELGELSEGMNQFISNIRNMVIDMRQTMLIAQGVCTNVSQNIHDVKESSGTISSAVGLVTEDISEQGESIRQTVAIAKELKELVYSLSDSEKHISQSVDSATNNTKSGILAVDTLRSDMERTLVSVKMMAETFAKLVENSDEIAGITEVIAGISEQTNMLALNAAIEAARAGEHGRGFAVVADEVRNLAESTSGSTRKIEGLIEHMRALNASVSGELSRLTAVIQSQSGSMDASNTLFHTIGETVMQINQQTSVIDQAIQRVGQKTNHIVELADTIQTSSERIISTVEEVNAETEEQVAVLTGIDEQSHRLYESVQKLDNSIGNFTV